MPHLEHPDNGAQHSECARGRAPVDVLLFCVQGHFGPERLRVQLHLPDPSCISQQHPVQEEQHQQVSSKTHVHTEPRKCT